MESAPPFFCDDIHPPVSVELSSHGDDRELICERNGDECDAKNSPKETRAHCFSRGRSRFPELPVYLITCNVTSQLKCPEESAFSAECALRITTERSRPCPLGRAENLAHVSGASNIPESVIFVRIIRRPRDGRLLEGGVRIRTVDRFTRTYISYNSLITESKSDYPPRRVN